MQEARCLKVKCNYTTGTIKPRQFSDKLSSISNYTDKTTTNRYTFSSLQPLIHEAERMGLPLDFAIFSNLFIEWDLKHYD